MTETICPSPTRKAQEPCEVYVKADIEGFQTKVFTMSQHEAFPDTLVKPSARSLISNEALKVEIQQGKHSVVLNVTHGDQERSFEFGLGMYVTGQYNP